jgi:Cu/Zn superoxide dismutase
VINMRVTLIEGEATLFDKDGSALVLHPKGDDYASQPTGVRATACLRGDRARELTHREG